MKNSTLLDRWFPHPFVSCLVFLGWLMLSHGIELGDLVIALILAVIIPRLVAPFVARTPHIQWIAALKLIMIVLWDIVVANFRIAKMILGRMDQLHPKWYRVPLETKHEQVNTLLAMIITTTPGTVSAGIDQERGDILVHALSTDDTEFDIQDIKNRYELPLIEIFDVKLEQGDAE